MPSGVDVYHALLVLAGSGICASGLFLCFLGSIMFDSSDKGSPSDQGFLQLGTMFGFFASALGAIGVFNVVSGSVMVYYGVYG